MINIIPKILFTHIQGTHYSTPASDTPLYSIDFNKKFQTSLIQENLHPDICGKLVFIVVVKLR